MEQKLWRGIPEYWIPGKTDTPVATKAALDRARRYLNVSQRKGRSDRGGAHYEHYDRLVQTLQTRYDTQVENAKPSTGERFYQTGMNVVAVATGLGTGHVIAENINKRHQASIGAKNIEAKKLASLTKSGAAKIVGDKTGQASRQLRAAANVSHHMRLTNPRGPLGLGTAAILAAEGAFSRFVLAPEAEKSGNKTTAEAFRATGTASAFAATGIISARMIHNATPTHLPNAANAALIKKGEMIANHAFQNTPNARVLEATQLKKDVAALLGSTTAKTAGVRMRGRSAGRGGKGAAIATGVVAALGLAYAAYDRLTSSKAKATPTGPPAPAPRKTGIQAPARNPRRLVDYKIRTGKRKGQTIRITQAQKAAYEGR